MPIDEIIEETPMENQENPEDNPTDNPIDFDDIEVGNDESLVQEENGSQDAGADSDFIEDVPDSSPSNEEEYIEIEEENISFEDDNEIDFNETETDIPDYGYYGLTQTASVENVEVYTDLEAFESSSVQVDLYQYTILNRLEFMQYALCIVIALLFLQIFVRYKK